MERSEQCLTVEKDPLERLLSFDPLASRRWSLAGVQQLAQELGHPEKEYATIHIAGTNGKGSVAWKVSDALMKAGYRVGRFTSPHLDCYSERIAINGQNVALALVREELLKLFALADRAGMPKRFFELTTLLAFVLFARARVDLAVIEVGIGGRLDPTNIISPLATAITTIDKDHCSLLGGSRMAIAKEKGGIIKRRVPVVLGPRALLPPILAIAREKKAPVYRVQRTCIDTEEENQAIARAVLDVVKKPLALPCSVVESALVVRPPCRFEKWGNVIYDVAHNPVSFKRLFTQIERLFPARPLYVVLALSKDKEIKRCLKAIAPYAAAFYLPTVECNRLVCASQLKQELDDLSFQGAVTCGALTDLTGAAQQHAQLAGALLVVTGSFYIMQAAKKAFS